MVRVSGVLRTLSKLTGKVNLASIIFEPTAQSVLALALGLCHRFEHQSAREFLSEPFTLYCMNVGWIQIWHHTTFDSTWN